MQKSQNTATTRFKFSFQEIVETMQTTDQIPGQKPNPKDDDHSQKAQWQVLRDLRAFRSSDEQQASKILFCCRWSTSLTDNTGEIPLTSKDPTENGFVQRIFRGLILFT